MPYYDYDNVQPIATVAEGLQLRTVPDLKKLVGLLPTSERPQRKDALITLALRYLEGDRLRELWSQLDTLQQAAVAEAVYAEDNRYHADRFIAKYGKEPNWGSRNRYGYDEEPSRLQLFFFRGVVPEDLKALLKSFVPAPKKTSLRTLDAPPFAYKRTYQDYAMQEGRFQKRIVETEEELPIEQREMERAAQHDLIAALRLVSAGKVSVSDKTSFPTAATIKALTPLLQGGDYYAVEDRPARGEYEDEQEIGPIKAFAWPLILQAARLVEMSGKRLALTKAGQKALTAPPAVTLRTAWQAWQKTTLLDELRRINSIRGQTGKGKQGLTAVSRRRPMIAKALADCPVGRWLQIDDFLRYMRAANYDFEVTRDPWSLYIAEPGYGYLGQGGDTWYVLQGRYTLCLLFEYAATMGLLDVAYVPPAGVRHDYSDLWGTDDLEFFSRYDGLRYIRLTPLGAYCLGLTDTYTPLSQQHQPILKALPTREVVVTEEGLSSGDALLLEMYAEKTAEAVWRLDQSRILAAMENGHDPAELQEFLRTRSGMELPPTVKRFLDEMAARGGSLKDKGVARLIECADAMLANLIATDTRTKRLCFLAGERYLVVPAESEQAFRRAVKQLGYFVPI